MKYAVIASIVGMALMLGYGIHFDIENGTSKFGTGWDILASAAVIAVLIVLYHVGKPPANKTWSQWALS